MKPTKFFLTVIAIIALSLAALFFRSQKSPEPAKNLKPSQLDFTADNNLQEPEAFANGVPAPPAPTAVSVPAPGSSVMAVFEEILKSDNDNDPRLDTVLRQLSPENKAALYKRYESLPAEDRNGRGLIVFLIARDLNSAADIEFLNKVFEEQPCLSLGDCKNTGSDDPHFSGLNQTTLNYPQFAGLFQLESRLASRPQLLQNPEFKSQIQYLLKLAENFPVPEISEKADELRRKFNL